MNTIKDINILFEIYKKTQKSDTGFALHYMFLYSLIQGLECKNVFEFGSGFSTHIILKLFENTSNKLTSCDITHFNKNKNITEFTTKSNNWCFYHGNSTKIFDSIEHDQYDLILHDGSHIGSEVLIDLNNIYPYLKNNGILLVHDTLHPSLGKHINEVVEIFKKDKELESCTLPYGYGLTVIRNQSNKKHPVRLTWKKN